MKKNALNYVLSVSVIKNFRFMKVILHSVIYPSCKREEIEALCGKSCDLLDNKANPQFFKDLMFKT